MSAYYNEIDPYAAAWLRNLIRDGHIADGVVDERSISDVKPEELYEFTQCHFFAGIGIWSHALRQSGWEDDRPVWTGSCPCQPFSGAGSRKGMADERHLWPHWFHLIEECRPPTVFGEQVASKDGLGWIDLVQADMEGADYAIGAFDLCSAGFGAPHIRQRLWFVADTDNPRSQGWISRGSDTQRQDQHGHVGRSGTTDRLAYAESEQGASRDHGGEPRQVSEPQQIQSGGSGSGAMGVAYATSSGRQHESRERSTEIQSEKTRDRTLNDIGGHGTSTDGMGDTDHGGSQGSGETRVGQGVEQSGSQSSRASTDIGMDDTISDRRHEGRNGDHGRNVGEQPDPDGKDVGMGNAQHDGQSATSKQGSDDQDAPDDKKEQIVPVQSEGASISRDDRSGDGGKGRGDTETRAYETNGFWADADWLLCRDGKWRPVRPESFPLAHGATARVGRLRAYGNAITAQVAQGLIESYMEVKQ